MIKKILLGGLAVSVIAVGGASALQVQHPIYTHYTREGGTLQVEPVKTVHASPYGVTVYDLQEAANIGLQGELE